MKIYKFFEHTNNKTRSIPLEKDEFLSILKNKCKNWYNNPKPLIRFKNNVNPHSVFSKINPKLSKRRSINEHNYNTMLIDNLPSWSEFPKRSESVIFYNKIGDFLTDFGKKFYFVIPFDGAKIGVAPDNDLWNSHNKDITMSFNNSFSKMLDLIGAPDNNYEKFKKYMNNLEPSKLTSGNHFINISQKFISNIYNKFKSNSYGKFNTFMEFLNYLLRPSNFYGKEEGYKVLNYTDIINKRVNLECWTDSECLIIYGGTVEGGIDNIKNNHVDWQIRKSYYKTMEDIHHLYR